MGEGFPLIAGAGDFGTMHPAPKKWTTQPSRISEPGDLLVCVRATIGDLNWADRQYCLGRGVAGVRVNGSLATSGYVARFLDANKQQLAKLGTGSTFPAIRRADLEDFLIPLPPLTEQKRIAAILDAADALRAKRRESIEQLDSLIQATFLEMFGDPVTNPKGWEAKSLADLCERIVDCPHSTPTYSDTPTDFFCVRSSDIQNGHIDLSAACHVTKAVFEDRVSRHVPQTGEVVYTREGGRLGLAGMIPPHRKICLGQRMMLFCGSPGVAQNAYLWGFLNSDSVYRTVVAMSGGGAAPRVNIKQLKELQVLCPPLDLQNRFASIVESIEQQKARLKAHLAELDTLFASLQSRAFNGELVA
jgi:type I restriction enzyme S subunit